MKAVIADKIRRRLGIVITIIALVMTVINIHDLIAQKKYGIIGAISSVYVYPLFISGILAFLTVLFRHPLSLWFQFFLILAASLLAVQINNIGDLSGTILFVFAVLVGLQTGILKKFFLLKVGIFLALFLGSCGVKLISEKVNVFPTLLPIIVSIFGFIYLYWMIFAEEIRQYSIKTRELQEEIEKNRPFVHFGKNVTGVIHNIRSSLNSVFGYIDLIKENSDQRTVEYFELQRKAADNINTMIDNLLFAVRSYQNIERREISLNSLIDGCLELQRANLRIRNTIGIDFDRTDDDKLIAVPTEIIQVIQNITSNAFNAIMDEKNPELRFKTYRRDDFIVFSVWDNGPPVPFCGDCEKNDCMFCLKLDAYSSSMSGSHGFGLIFVRDTMREFGGRFYLKSLNGNGVSVELWFPVNRPIIDSGFVKKPATAGSGEYHS